MRRAVKAYLSLGLAVAMVVQTVPAGAAEVVSEPVGESLLAEAQAAWDGVEPTGEAVDLSGYSLAYDAATLDLSEVSLEANASWLIVGAAEETSDTYLAYDLPEADQNWNVAIPNKNYTVQLKKGETVVDAAADWSILAWGDKTKGVIIEEDNKVVQRMVKSKDSYNKKISKSNLKDTVEGKTSGGIFFW